MVNEPIRALSLLAQTSMRSEIGKLQLDKTFEERESLNISVQSALNDASEKWGIHCMRYEIKDIKPPERIKTSMGLQAESERVKRSSILQSEGQRQSKINIAEGEKQAMILDGEGAAEKITQEALSIVESLRNIGDALLNDRGVLNDNALKLRLTEQYLSTLGEVYKEAKIVGLPESTPGSNGNPFSTENVATSIALYKHIMGSGAAGVDMSAADIQKMTQSVQKLSSEVEAAKLTSQSASRSTEPTKYTYLDDKALY